MQNWQRDPPGMTAPLHLGQFVQPIIVPLPLHLRQGRMAVLIAAAARSAGAAAGFASGIVGGFVAKYFTLTLSNALVNPPMSNVSVFVSPIMVVKRTIRFVDVSIFENMAPESVATASSYDGGNVRQVDVVAFSRLNRVVILVVSTPSDPFWW
jgi:hypothetical protein